MKTNALFYIATMLTVTAYGDTVNFDNETPGTLPPHWVGTQTGLGKAKWSIEKAEDAPSKPNVLKQSGEATFPVCIKDDTKLKDGFVEVKFKPVAGKEDQAGGVIWRCKDANNYYIARANALEANVTIYHTIGGNCYSTRANPLGARSRIILRSKLPTTRLRRLARRRCLGLRPTACDAI